MMSLSCDMQAGTIDAFNNTFRYLDDISLCQGLSKPEFYGDLVYKLKTIVGSYIFSAQFIKIISHYKNIGCNINVSQQTACLVVPFNCTPVGRTSDTM